MSLSHPQAVQIVERAWKEAVEKATTIGIRVPQNREDADTMVAFLSHALVGLSERAQWIDAPMHIHQIYPDTYGIPMPTDGIFLREEYGIPHRKNSAAKILRLALVMAGLVSVTDRSGVTVAKGEAIGSWFSSELAHQGYLVSLLPQAA